MRLQQISGIH